MSSIPIKHILLIQDDASKAKGIIEALCNSHDVAFQVDWVRHLSEALERLAGIAAILVDLFLPDSRGIKTFERLFSAAPNIPILILTDPQDEETAKSAVQRGAQDYLFKGRLDSYLLPKALDSMIERTTISEALFEQNERALVTLNSIGDAVISIDVTGRVTYLNVVAEALTGWSQEEAVGHLIEEVFRIVDGSTREAAPNPMARAIRENKTVALTPNCVLIRRDGVEAAIEDSAAPIHNRHGKATGAVIVFHDVSVARAMTLKMTYLAQHDSLTDLPNRVLMNDRLEEAIVLSGRHRRKLAVLFVDLDRFKRINDSLGHVIGDRVLQTVAGRLFTCVRSSDTVCRHGGDEFVVLLWEERHALDATIPAEKILQAMRQPFYIDQHVLHVTASIGIVIYPGDGMDADSLLKNADAAMYHAKDCGRDNYRFFEPGMNARAAEKQSIEGDLRYALQRGELFLHYQAKVDLVSEAIVGVEALIRWNHPRRGLVAPGDFIEIAEESGLIVAIGRWVLRESCRQARAWQDAGIAPIRIAVNTSAVELRADEFMSHVVSSLADSGLQARNLEVELTETFLMQEAGSTLAVLRELRAMGVHLALDDFGTGYSSLSYLQRFPIDTLKIDRSFVQNLATDDDDANIVRAVIAMGKSLHMRVVAEGIETREQLEFLRAHGCPVGQGFYFSRPMPALEFGKLLEHSLKGAALSISERAADAMATS
jgi:diguanylate cyclase (GGDEF)-like protein/PAS domain S-box-containing protein